MRIINYKEHLSLATFNLMATLNLLHVKLRSACMLFLSQSAWGRAGEVWHEEDSSSSSAKVAEEEHTGRTKFCRYLVCAPVIDTWFVLQLASHFLRATKKCFYKFVSAAKVAKEERYEVLPILWVVLHLKRHQLKNKWHTCWPTLQAGLDIGEIEGSACPEACLVQTKHCTSAGTMLQLQ